MDVEFGFLPNERTRFKPQSLKKGAPQTAELAKDLAGFRAVGHAGGEGYDARERPPGISRFERAFWAGRADDGRQFHLAPGNPCRCESENFAG